MALPVPREEALEDAQKLPTLHLRMVLHGEGVCVDVPTQERKDLVTVSLPLEVEELRLDPVIDAVVRAQPPPAFILLESHAGVSSFWWKELGFRLKRKGYLAPRLQTIR